MVKAIWIAILIAITSITFTSPVVALAVEISNEQHEWDLFHADAFEEYADEFTALFNSYSYKRSKNGRSMINGKFVAMPKG